MPSFLASFPDFLALGLVLLLTGERRPETKGEEQVEGELSWGSEGRRGGELGTGKWFGIRKRGRQDREHFFLPLDYWSFRLDHSLGGGRVLSCAFSVF